MNLNDVAAETLSKEIQVKIDEEIMEKLLGASKNLLDGSNVSDPRIQKERDRFDEVKRLQKELGEANIAASKLVRLFEPITEALYETAKILNDLLIDHNPAFSENEEELKEARARIYKNGVAKYIQNIIKKNGEALTKWEENTIVRAEQEKIVTSNGPAFGQYLPLISSSIVGHQPMNTPSSKVFYKDFVYSKDDEDCLEAAKNMIGGSSMASISGLATVPLRSFVEKSFNEDYYKKI